MGLAPGFGALRGTSNFENSSKPFFKHAFWRWFESWKQNSSICGTIFELRDVIEVQIC